MSVQSCCVAAVFGMGYTSFTVGDGSPGDLIYQTCVAAGGAYYTDPSGNPCNGAAVSNAGGYSSTPATPGPPAMPSVPIPIPMPGSSASATKQDACPAFSITDPGPALQCFAFTILRYLFVNLAAAAVFAYGLKLAFPTGYEAAATTVKTVGKTSEEAAAG
jgi:hypothetical protein